MNLLVIAGVVVGIILVVLLIKLLHNVVKAVLTFLLIVLILAGLFFVIAAYDTVSLARALSNKENKVMLVQDDAVQQGMIVQGKDIQNATVLEPQQYNAWYQDQDYESIRGNSSYVFFIASNQNATEVLNPLGLIRARKGVTVYPRPTTLKIIDVIR